MFKAIFCSWFLLFLLAGVVCMFCRKDFVSLGHHAWRCKHRITRAEHPSAGMDEDVNESVTADPSPRICLMKCCCCRIWKGNRGLKMHQRSCGVVLDLNYQLRADLDDAALTYQESDDVGVPSMASSFHAFPSTSRSLLSQY